MEGNQAFIYVVWWDVCGGSYIYNCTAVGNLIYFTSTFQDYLIPLPL